MKPEVVALRVQVLSSRACRRWRVPLEPALTLVDDLPRTSRSVSLVRTNAGPFPGFHGGTPRHATRCPSRFSFMPFFSYRSFWVLATSLQLPGPQFSGLRSRIGLVARRHYHSPRCGRRPWRAITNPRLDGDQEPDPPCKPFARTPASRLVISPADAVPRPCWKCAAGACPGPSITSPSTASTCPPPRRPSINRAMPTSLASDQFVGTSPSGQPSTRAIATSSVMSAW